MASFMSFSGLYGVRRILNLWYKTMFTSGMSGHMLYINGMDESCHSKSLLKKLRMIMNLLVNMAHSVLSMGINGGTLTPNESINSKMLSIP